MSTRLMVTLSDAEAAALARIACAELRDPREQLRLMLRQDLLRRGLLHTEKQHGDVTPAQPAALPHAQPQQAEVTP